MSDVVREIEDSVKRERTVNLLKQAFEKIAELAGDHGRLRNATVIEAMRNVREQLKGNDLSNGQRSGREAVANIRKEEMFADYKKIDDLLKLIEDTLNAA